MPTSGQFSTHIKSTDDYQLKIKYPVKNISFSEQQIIDINKTFDAIEHILNAAPNNQSETFKLL